MQLRPEMQIQSMLKALADVILPAVDPGNRLAQEQTRLLMGHLMLLQQRLPLEYRFDVDELERLLGFAAKLRRQARGAAQIAQASAQVQRAVEQGRDVRRRARAEPTEVVDAVHRLRDATSSLVEAVFAEAGASTRRAVTRSVLSMSAEQVLRERSSLVAQGWEPDASAIPAVEGLLAPVAGTRKRDEVAADTIG